MVGDRLSRVVCVSAIEKSFFIQVLVIANVLFPVIFAAQLRRVFGEPSAVVTVWSVFVPYLFFGFYQELCTAECSRLNWIVAVMHGIGNAYIVVSLRSMQ